MKLVQTSGLPKFYDDPRKELRTSGVFKISPKAKLEQLSTDLIGTNGIDFSPDERYLYVANWDPKHKVVMRYELAKDGGLMNGRVFFDTTEAPGEEPLDGIDGNAHALISPLPVPSGPTEDNSPTRRELFRGFFRGLAIR